MPIIPPVDSKDRILKFAREKFHKEGFYKTSMDEIARQLQISKKTIYKHFASKETLLEELCTHTTCDINKQVSAIIDGEGDVVRKFIKLLSFYSGFMANISDKWIHDIRVHAPWLKAQIDKNRDEKINQMLVKLLEQGKKEKLIENYPTPIIISVFTSSLQCLTSPEFLINNKFSMQSAFKYTYDILLSGILTEKGKEKYNQGKSSLQKELKLK